MRQRLDQYLALCESYESEMRNSRHEYSQTAREIDEAAQAQQPTVERILAALDPQLVEGIAPLGYELSNIERRIRQGIGHLNDRDEWAIRLAPDAPTLQADRMHPLIWAAAAPIWPTKQFRVAVHQSANALSAHLKSRANSHLNDRELVAQVFSPEPPKAGQARLHVTGERIDKGWQSKQQGLQLLAQGCFAGIRNAAAHTSTDWTEQEGIEYLAVLSVVARWADQTSVVRAE